MTGFLIGVVVASAFFIAFPAAASKARDWIVRKGGGGGEGPRTP